MTGEQIRAARALARWQQADLAEHSGVSAVTIKRLESIRGAVGAQTGTINSIEAAFAKVGVRFSASGGVEIESQ